MQQEHYSESNLLQFSHSIFCKNIVCLAVAREHHFGIARCDAPWQRRNEHYSYITNYWKVVAYLILSNVPVAYLFKILIVKQL